MNDSKTWLVVKEEAEFAAHDLFKDSSINISTEGRPCLGAPIGTATFINEFVSAKMEYWRSVFSILSDKSSSSLHTAYAAYTHGISNL